MSALPNTNSNSFLFTSKASRKKKINQPEWTWFYEESDFPNLMRFVEENLRDIPQYSKNTQEDIKKLCYVDEERTVMNYESIYKLFIYLRIYYAAIATQKIISYVGSRYQHGSKNIIRPTLNVLISLFGSNIVEEFERDFTMDKLREILQEQLYDRKFLKTAYIISKDPKINIGLNSRIKYNPGVLQLMSNTLESKKTIFSFLSPFSYSQHPLTPIDMKFLFGISEMNLPKVGNYGPLSAPGRTLLKGLGGLYEKEINGYERNLRKNWSHCLPNEIEKGILGNCVAIPYLRLDISDEGKQELLAELLEIIKRITSLPDDRGEETPREIINEYDLKKYIGDTSGIKPASYHDLMRYAKEEKIAVEKGTTSKEVAFVILYNMFNNAISNLVTEFCKVLPIYWQIAPAIFEIPPRTSLSTCISVLKNIKKKLPAVVKENFEEIITYLIEIARAYKTFYLENMELF